MFITHAGLRRLGCRQSGLMVRVQMSAPRVKTESDSGIRVEGQNQITTCQGRQEQGCSETGTRLGQDGNKAGDRAGFGLELWRSRARARLGKRQAQGVLA